MKIILSKTVQPISTKMYYVLFAKILQGADSISGTALRKTGVREFSVKTPDRCPYKEFLKIYF